jgi:hypothetical protein
MTTYEIIRAIPAKGFNWTGFNTALRAKVVAADAAQAHTLVEWDAAKGMRAVRIAAMEMACFYADKVSKRVNIIQPSDESKAWDSFEGGHHDVWNDRDAMEAATQEVAAMVTNFRTPK